MRSPIDIDREQVTASDATGYFRFAFGPPRPGFHESRGWYLGSGELAMTAGDLARWDQALFEGKLLRGTSLRQMLTPVSLSNGAPGFYGLGFFVWSKDGHLVASHDGGMAGFLSFNQVWFDQRTAVVVLTNIDTSDGPSSLAKDVSDLVVPKEADPQAPRWLAEARKIFSDLQSGNIDRSMLTTDASDFFTPEKLADAKAGLNSLGEPRSFEQASFGERGGMTFRIFRASFGSGKTATISTFVTSDGKWAQYLIF
jgi:hypothetical protein